MNDGFDFGGYHALGLEQRIAEVLVAAASSEVRIRPWFFSGLGPRTIR